MSYGNQSYLRFSLEESVWFQKGQEVAELISISLDPNITIHESDQYVTIKGSLELSGEYNGEESELEDEFDFYTNPKLVQSIEVREEGVHLFSHHFPVEVTIPKNRIQSINDIDVAVETFDYAFPEKSCLRLSADLMIMGLYGEQQHELLQEQVDENEEIFEYDPLQREEEFSAEEEISVKSSPFSKPVFDDESDGYYTPFEVEARKEPLIEDQYSDQYHADHQEDEPYVIGRHGDDIQEEDENEDPYKAPEFAFPVMRDEEETPSLAVDDTDDEDDCDVCHNLEPEAAGQPDESESSSSPEHKAKKKKWKNNQSLTLSEFFARKEEEAHTRLKMCIVQKGDTLNLLSERYDVTVSQLQKVNYLELNQDIHLGQVIYIPVAQIQR